MSFAQELILSHPGGLDADAQASCIDACVACAQACTACADACLGEDSVSDLRRCITLCLNCADVCETTARAVSRTTGFDSQQARVIVEASIATCRACRAECEHHGAMGMEHCAICARACRQCEEACQALLSVL